MRFFAPLLMLAAVIAALIDVSAAQSRIDRSAAWFKPSPNVRSPSYSRSRLGGSRLLPRRMYRSLGGVQSDVQGIWERMMETEPDVDA